MVQYAEEYIEYGGTLHGFVESLSFATSHVVWFRVCVFSAARVGKHG
jgi:hypothetical protein